MDKDFFIYETKKMYNEMGDGMYQSNQRYIADIIKGNNDSFVVKTTPANLIPGSFYFIYYDLAGKSSKMEQFNPILYLQSFDIDNTRMFYSLNLNFLPINLRVLFFNEVLNNSLDIIDKNYKIDVLNQQPLNGINFITIYNMLRGVGFEWAIRKLDLRKLNNVVKISTNILPQFITMSTAQYTGVDDNKLIQIWQTKIKDRHERDKKIMKELLNDFNNIKKEFAEKYKSVNDQEKNIKEALASIKNL